MEIKTLAKNTVLLSSPTVLKFFVGIIKSKLIAIFLGVTGAGVINQLQNTISQVATFTVSSLPEGMVKLIAQQNGIEFDVKKIMQIIKTYLIVVIPLTIFVTILGYIFMDKLTIYLFGGLNYKLYVQIGLIALPFSIISITLSSLLASFKEIKAISLAGLFGILLNFLLFLPLIYFFKLTGAVIFVSLSILVSFLILYYFVRNNILKKYNITFSLIYQSVYSKVYFKELIGFMSFGLIAGTYYIFTEVSTRAIVVNELGIDKLGIYAPIEAWASLFVGFILPSLNTYLFPRISEAQSNNEIVGVVNDVIRLMTFVTLPFVIVGISVRQWIIPIFYSEEFSEAAMYLPYHFCALLFVIWTYAFTNLFAPTGRLKTFLVFALLVHSLSLALVYFLVPYFEMYGYLAKFTITPVFSFTIYAIYWFFEIRFRLNKENMQLIIFSLVVVVMLLLTQNKSGFLQIFGLISIVLMFFLLKKNEKAFIEKKMKRIVKR